QREQELREQEQATQEKEEPLQNTGFRQLIGEMCGTKVCEEQKQNMEDTMLEFLEDCGQKDLYCMHNDVEDLIESALNSKLLLINLKSQRLDKEKQELKDIVEHAPKRRTQPKYSLSMGDEHLSTILEMESDEVIKSSVENLVPIPSDSEVTFDNKSECDVPVNDESFPIFTTFSNHLFDCNDDFTSSDDKSLSNDNVPMENFKIYSSPLFDEEIVSTKIEEADLDLEKEIRLVENLLYNNSSSRPPKELNAEIADTILKSLSPSHILVEDSKPQIEEIDLFLATDDLMPPGIENDDYDSEGDIHFVEELLSDDPLPIPENKSSNFDHYDDPSFPRPPPEPPDVEVFFYFEPDTDVWTAKMMEDISEHYVLMPNILPTQPTFCPNIDTLLLFSSKNEDKVFKPGILSYLLVSHRDKITFDFSESLMMMYGRDIPHLDVPFLHLYPP
nr:hypothetical protein [Tanacetum cinerariifolium]